jgi:hypothetical protein
MQKGLMTRRQIDKGLKSEAHKERDVWAKVDDLEEL